MRKGRQQGMVAHHGPAEWSDSRPAARPKLASPKPLSRRSAGLNRPAYFLALDSLDHGGTLLRSAVYLAAWYSFASPRAVVWQMYLVTAAIVYACTGQAYLLSQARAAATSGHVPAAGKGTQGVRPGQPPEQRMGVTLSAAGDGAVLGAAVCRCDVPH